jgi:hypothetical protein
MATHVQDVYVYKVLTVIPRQHPEYFEPDI